MLRPSFLAIAFFLAACAHVTPPIEQGVIADRLFCGRAIPGGGSVSDEEWSAFVHEMVTPRFPDGFTVWRAEGQWKGSDGTVREPVMIIEILHPFDRRFDVMIEEIADEYRRRFRQDAVMRVTMPARMEFVD